MKYFLLMMGIITFTTSLMTMETRMLNKQPNGPYITIINKIPANIVLRKNERTDIVLNNRITISDEQRINELYDKVPEPRHVCGYSLDSNQGVYCTPRKNNNKYEHERLGFNNAGTAALIHLFIHASAKTNTKLLQLFVGEKSEIQFGDTLTFNCNPYQNSYITLNHTNKNNTILVKIPFIQSVKIIGASSQITDPLLMRISNAQ